MFFKFKKCQQVLKLLLKSKYGMPKHLAWSIWNLNTLIQIHSGQVHFELNYKNQDKHHHNMKA